MATSCFQSPPQEDDSIVLFSNTSDSNEESASSSSSCHHYSPPPPPSSLSTTSTTYQLNVTNLSYTINQNKSIFSTKLFTNPVPFLSTCTLNNNQPKIDILKSVSFTAKSSEILAIVGPSGTGKSTLLRIISGRIQNKHFIPNTISLNNHPITTPSQLRKFCGYVAQEDDLLPLLTVKETLMFSAKFRLTTTTNLEERVNSLMQELGLSHVADSFVGSDDEDHDRGISGGERKRVSIGVDMIHEPSILVLDEPTSGLDSSSALQVIELLSNMARNKHKTVLISIHQPSYRILRHVSSFLILSGGKGVHNGSIELLEQRIERLGYDVPYQINPLEFAMEVEIINKLEESFEDHSKEFMMISKSNHEKPCGCDHGRQGKLIQQLQPPSSDSKAAADAVYDYWLEIMHLCSRFWKVIYRTKQLFLARTMQALVGGFGLGSVYINIRNQHDQTGNTNNSNNNVAERLGLFAFSLSFLLSSTVEALPIYLQERRVLMKESSRKAYKISSYMIANTLIFLPFLFLVALLFSVPVYWIVGLNPSLSAFVFFVFVVWIILLMASSLVLFLSAVSPDFISGNSLIGTVLGIFFLFSGYFIPKEIIPKYWMFMYYVSLYRYPLDCLLVNEYWSRKDECFVWQGDSNGCLMTGMDVLRGRGLERDSRWINVGIMFGFFLFYRFVCCIILARRASKTII